VLVGTRKSADVENQGCKDEFGDIEARKIAESNSRTPRPSGHRHSHSGRSISTRLYGAVHRSV
jgi:hypothetical protein